jgi:hypothetical protein
VRIQSDKLLLKLVEWPTPRNLKIGDGGPAIALMSGQCLVGTCHDRAPVSGIANPNFCPAAAWQRAGRVNQRATQAPKMMNAA